MTRSSWSEINKRWTNDIVIASSKKEAHEHVINWDRILSAWVWSFTLPPPLLITLSDAFFFFPFLFLFYMSAPHLCLLYMPNVFLILHFWMIEHTFVCLCSELLTLSLTGGWTCASQKLHIALFCQVGELPIKPITSSKVEPGWVPSEGCKSYVPVWWSCSVKWRSRSSWARSFFLKLIIRWISMEIAYFASRIQLYPSLI